MSDIITLTCPSCGGKLEITEDIARFACAHCGTEHLVNRGGGIVSLKPVTEELTKIQSGVDKTASELAINRLNDEIVNLDSKVNEIVAKMNENVRLFPDIGLSYVSIFCGVCLLLLTIGLIIWGNDNYLVIFIAGLTSIVSLGWGFTSKGEKKMEIKRFESEYKKLLAQKQNLKSEIEMKKIELAEHKKIVRK